MVEINSYYAKERTEPEEGIEVNEKGGKQSKVGVRYDLIDPIAIQKLAQVFHEGAEKYDEWNWLKIDCRSHLNHALNHIYLWLGGDESGEDHLAHALCRLTMAVRKEEDENG